MSYALIPQGPAPGVQVRIQGEQPCVLHHLEHRVNKADEQVGMLWQLLLRTVAGKICRAHFGLCTPPNPSSGQL